MCWFASLPDNKQVFVECGAGQAELACYFAQTFDMSIATDISPPVDSHIIAEKQNMSYVMAPAEVLPIPDNSVDMLLSMQSLHYFDVKKHFSEVSRVLKNGGILGALAWGSMQIPEHVANEYKDIFALIDMYWERDRDWVVNGYSDLTFNGVEIKLPQTSLRCKMNNNQLIQTILKWSATRAAFADITSELQRLISNQSTCDLGVFKVSWPIVGKVYRFSDEPLNRQVP